MILIRDLLAIAFISLSEMFDRLSIACGRDIEPEATPSWVSIYTADSNGPSTYESEEHPK